MLRLAQVAEWHTRPVQNRFSGSSNLSADTFQKDKGKGMKDKNEQVKPLYPFSFSLYPLQAGLAEWAYAPVLETGFWGFESLGRHLFSSQLSVISFKST